MAQIEEVAFPRLTSAELTLVKPLATPRDYADGEVIFRAGQADIDLYIVESGQIEIRNPTDGDRRIVTHDPGQFSGDIDLLTGRPVIVTGVAKGATRVLRILNSQLRALLNRVPGLGEKLIVAFTRRRELLHQLGCVLSDQAVAAPPTRSASFFINTLSPSRGSTRKRKPASTISRPWARRLKRRLLNVATVTFS
jgi:CRP-like cAMP-binding protein